MLIGGLKLVINCLCTRLRKLRQHLELSQEEFAHQIGVTVSTCARWEKGQKPGKASQHLINDFLETLQWGARQEFYKEVGDCGHLKAG